ncbi:MBL fold metallo-hydrolase [Bryobacter aggregatus]|uniref:MBL fold metallo-hydrolase n=1 Tax=Bryobacter aggregatus TaxID=360054 RepID=UPI0004E1004B|nr:MBL fold metallo-hydrolase [Bryobacter aggregatus]
MPRKIDAELLRMWLEEKRPVTVIDVRNEEDRAQWSIPGSLHINAYEALKANQPSALSDAILPASQPIVTVCNLGKMSERAADELTSRGLDVFSLSGGMKAWSLAWNTAEVALTNAHVTQVRRTGKGCLSYLISSNQEAAVIDASLPIDVYRSLAERQGLRIRYVIDTHIHADHVSRSRQLADAMGAELLLPPQNRVHFGYRSIAAHEVIRIGAAKLEAIPTPGHTMESMSFLLDGEALFTGDTLFTSSVGRPDLHADPGQARARASRLYTSVQQLLALAPGVLVFPGHTGTPAAFDGVAIRERLDVVAERLRHWMESEESFVEQILAHIPPTPPNYIRIVELNEGAELPAGDLTELEAGANRCAIG